MIPVELHEVPGACSHEKRVRVARDADARAVVRRGGVLDNGRQRGGAKDVFGNGVAAFGGGPAGARRGVASLSVALFVMSHLTAGTPRTSSGFSMNCR